MFQTTLKEAVTFSGVGLHSAKFINVKVIPAFADTGIQFRRTDVFNCEFVRVSPYTVSSTQLATTITCGDLPISTIEHLMSALYGLGIDNAYVEVDGPEVPILDGSSAPIVDIIQETGIKTLSKKRKYLKFKKRVRLERDDKWIELIPSRFFKVTFQIDFEHEAIRDQKAFVNVTPKTYYDEVARARTFGFRKDVEALWRMGLAKGGTMDNAIIVDDDGVANPDGLRFEDEFVRHKVLDLVGDISLVGYRIFGHIRAHRSGHMLNNIFARTILEASNCYSIVELEEEDVMDATPALHWETQGTA